MSATRHLIRLAIAALTVVGVTVPSATTHALEPPTQFWNETAAGLPSTLPLPIQMRVESPNLVLSNVDGFNVPPCNN